MEHAIGKLRRLDDACEIKSMPLVDFAIAPVAPAVIGILIGVVHTRPVPVIIPGLIITNAMGPRVVAVNIDRPSGPVLYGNEHPVVALVTSVDDRRESADFSSERWVQETQPPPILRIGHHRAGVAWSDLEMGQFAIKKAVAVGVTDARNINRHIEWFRGLKVRDLGSNVAHRDKRARCPLFADSNSTIDRRSE